MSRANLINGLNSEARHGRPMDGRNSESRMKTWFG